ncbi:hypothetical protein IHE45_14G008900 [Dioscorea alata]|uniref:Uncharacterized protein n=1 Tax=Dioscorea alata TaxID=55571 RepID=A0ACB7UPS2_DIOAL|nr:hypothetical protein IHE45_14G008900 [Dioscorea alata]
MASLLCIMGNKKRVHAITWAKRSLLVVGEKKGFMCSCFLSMKQVVFKVKSQWKQALRSSCSCSSSSLKQSGGVRFGYDPESYSQNFDDGFLNEQHHFVS